MTDEPVNAFRNGEVHVVSEQCSTCIFRPGNLMMLEPGRVKDMVDQTVAADSAITCHSTLGTDQNAVCRGFFDAYDTTPLRLAQAFDVVVFDPPVSLHKPMSQRQE